MVVHPEFMKNIIFLLFLTIPLTAYTQEGTWIRVNLAGYLPADQKEAVLFSDKPIRGSFSVENELGQEVLKGAVTKADKGWGNFNHYYTLDFSKLTEAGVYRVRVSNARSQEFSVNAANYAGMTDDLLEFMRQQRCGYNPFLDMVCHKRDGRSMYGPMPDSSYVDVSGGWHDAGDQLKYLITSSNATARMLLAYELAPDSFSDLVNELGQPVPNQVPDILDEAKWGLDWLHKMHPAPGQLFHQVADDRDHMGWKWPDKDNSNYGWGPNSYRVAYYATGEPQGLREYKSEATGIANLAGRSAAALAMGARVWKSLGDEGYSAKCLQAARDLYAMGKAKEGYQQGNSFGAPYRYTEDTWADDMEWGAAELYDVTSEKAYLDDAVRYAGLAGVTSWMEQDSAAHYQFYPFVNVGHYSLYKHADERTRAKLAGYYQSGIEKILARSKTNPFSVGVPFIWCSSNLVNALVTQVLLYERMTDDRQYRKLMLAHRDWLLGRNPWGTSLFTGIPRNGEYPEDIHTSVWKLTGKMVPGGLVDGPISTALYNNLKGLTLTQPDKFAPFQNKKVVYHDDIGDYSTNEPTMDGTADAIYMMVYFKMNN